MKILALSDEECPALWEHYVHGRLREYDLIISCGDLKSSYLSFLVTMARCPVLYVHGNHDTGYQAAPPEGCDCIDDQIVVYHGIRILGLGGCKWYHPGKYQITEEEMRRRIKKLRFALWKTKGVDIVVTHAPPWGLGDGDDPAHMGFHALRELLDKYQPAYLLHGHVHMSYGMNIPREHEYNGSKVINVCQRYTLELPDKPFPEQQRYQLLWQTRRKEPEE